MLNSGHNVFRWTWDLYDLATTLACMTTNIYLEHTISLVIHR
jgi:hypothetical protein